MATSATPDFNKYRRSGANGMPTPNIGAYNPFGSTPASTAIRSAITPDSPYLNTGRGTPMGLMPIKAGYGGGHGHRGYGGERDFKIGQKGPAPMAAGHTGSLTPNYGSNLDDYYAQQKEVGGIAMPTDPLTGLPVNPTSMDVFNESSRLAKSGQFGQAASLRRATSNNPAERAAGTGDLADMKAWLLNQMRRSVPTPQTQYSTDTQFFGANGQRTANPMAPKYGPDTQFFGAGGKQMSNPYFRR